MAILDRATGELLGRSGLHYWPEFDETEVGWLLRRDAWGRGYATEAGQACADRHCCEDRLSPGTVSREDWCRRA